MAKIELNDIEAKTVLASLHTMIRIFKRVDEKENRPFIIEVQSLIKNIESQL